ncbi:hypothetical protein AA309_23910 [Microvirga vignae]|uniref:Polymerase beta nucleotidyltransferase domain-containing protein n=1 Tax=Microvirga vignae TaxID=1225564 RepID=A0A0H1R6G0_9HYPH|nr:hypothetical protein AA309_23910 [Microvirga vignae]
MGRPDLEAIAKIIADWLEHVPGVPAVYIFGSRVRGDHRPDSDLDIRLFTYEWCGGGLIDDLTSEWWGKQNPVGIAELEKKLHAPLHIISEKQDLCDNAIREGAKTLVYVDRKAVCVCTPPKNVRGG